jgi:hypothetical protein
MNRINKYRYWQKLSNGIARKLSAAKCNPLGRDAVLWLRRFEQLYDKLPVKWKALVDKKIESALNKYHTPIVQGRNGELYSAADMDSLMLRYS